MTALERPPLEPGAILASHVSFQLVNRRRLRSPHDVERDGLMRVATQALHFEIAKACVDRVAERGGWLSRSLKAEHALVPRIDGEPVGSLPGFGRALSRRPDRRAVDAFPRLGCHGPI